MQLVFAATAGGVLMGDDIPSLASTTFGSNLPPDVVSALVGLFREQSVPAGATIFREGDDTDVLSVIAAGEVSLVQTVNVVFELTK